MQALDLKDFIWQNKETKECTIILAITDFRSYDVVVYRYRDRNAIFIESVDAFCQDFEATYQLGLSEKSS